VTVLRYERTDPGGGPTEVVERPWLLHWYPQDGFRALATAAGLLVDAVVDPRGGPARAEAEEFVFLLRAPGTAAAD
jgi:hypothetical protein